MNVDHYFAIGSAHNAQGNPCEDFALSGMLASGAAYGIVADGCSGARANTDVGARALTYALKDVFAEHPVGAETFTPKLLARFEHNQYTGRFEDYLATVAGFIAWPNLAAVYVHGDGAMALRYADGRHCLIEWTWRDNKPFYLNYRLHQPLLDTFMLPYLDGIVEPFVQRTTMFAPDADGGAVLDARVERFTIEQVYQGHVLHFRPAEEGIVALAVLTDGIEQVGNVPPADVAREFLSFKTHQGEFVKRRLLRALKDFRKIDAIPRDDVGIAAVWFPEKA